MQKGVGSRLRKTLGDRNWLSVALEATPNQPAFPKALYRGVQHEDGNNHASHLRKERVKFLKCWIPVKANGGWLCKIKCRLSASTSPIINHRMLKQTIALGFPLAPLVVGTGTMESTVRSTGSYKPCAGSVDRAAFTVPPVQRLNCGPYGTDTRACRRNGAVLLTTNAAGPP